MVMHVYNYGRSANDLDNMNMLMSLYKLRIVAPKTVDILHYYSFDSYNSQPHFDVTHESSILHDLIVITNNMQVYNPETWEVTDLDREFAEIRVAYHNAFNEQI